MKNIQISEKLFVLLVRYHILNDESCCDDIVTGLQQKFDAIVTRNLYTKYKTSISEEEREKSRLEYLERKGYNKNFRW